MEAALGIQFDDVTLRRGDFTLKADLSISSEETIALIGPSGGGKSTLLNAIAGFIPLDTGKLMLEGENMAGRRPANRPVTLLFQDHNLFPHLSVYQNTALGLRPDLKLSLSEKIRVGEVLGEVGLGEFGDRYPDALSGGQRQRVALARALLRQKPILLLDEPFAALGPALKAEMLDLVARIVAQQAMTLVMVTHSPADAERIAKKIVLVSHGTAYPPQPTKALLADPPPELRDYLGG